MWYDLSKIEYVKAVKVKAGNKTDVQVQIKISIKLRDEIDVQNISVKLVSNEKWFNQIDKRLLKNYDKLWNFPADVLKLFQYFCWELKPYKSWTRDARRMFITEMTKEEQDKIFQFLNEKRLMIVSDILKGRWEFAAEWMLVVKKTSLYEWVLKSMNEVMNFYGNWEILISPQWSIKIWRITVQRKWGDWGRESANMLQFKIDPTQLFDI